MKPDRNDPRRRLERQYAQRLEQLISRFMRFGPQPTMGHIQGAVDDMQKAEQFLTDYGELASTHMLTGIAKWNAKSWRDAVKQSGRGEELHSLLAHELAGPVGKRVRAIVKENGKLVRSIPFDVRQAMTTEIGNMQRAGLRSEEIARRLQERVPQLTKNKARLIARTETSKATTALTRARSAEMNLPWYVWRTSEDARVRASHRHLDGVLVPWNNPPAPEALVGIRSTLGHYAAGDAPNCRCLPQPVLDLGDLSWPMKVYNGSTIVRMSRRAFETGYVQPRAA